MKNKKVEKLIKELRPAIENEVLYRYDNLQNAQDSADTLVEMIERSLTKALYQAKEDILEEVIPVHNARILNEFQKLEDMDERILFRAITKATKETLTPNDKE